MENKQTAVDWLVRELSNLGYIVAPSFGHSIIDEKIKQAKEMEKEQIIDAHYEGQCNNQEGYPKYIAIQYYSETYEGSDEKKDNKGMRERSKDRTQEYRC